MVERRGAKRVGSCTSWSDLRRCPDCGENTLRVFWVELLGQAPRATDEFCDNPQCTRGDQPLTRKETAQTTTQRTINS